MLPLVCTVQTLDRTTALTVWITNQTVQCKARIPSGTFCNNALHSRIKLSSQTLVDTRQLSNEVLIQPQ